MSASGKGNTRQRTSRNAHERISAAEARSGRKSWLLVLVIVFIALVAILLRLAEFAGRGIHRPASPPAPAASYLEQFAPPGLSC
jgi:hypothetical protein